MEVSYEGGQGAEGAVAPYMEWKSWFLLHDHATAHRSVMVKDFLTRNNVTTLDHPP